MPVIRPMLFALLMSMLLQLFQQPPAPSGWEDVGALITGILTEGGTLGLYSWGASALLISTIEKRRPAKMRDDEKRNLSIAVSGVAVIVAYVGGIALGIIVLDGNSLLKAIRIFGTEVGFAKGLHAATKQVQSMGGASSGSSSGRGRAGAD